MTEQFLTSFLIESDFKLRPRTIEEVRPIHFARWEREYNKLQNIPLQINVLVIITSIFFVYEHVTLILRGLHWLQSQERIYFKLTVLV